MPLFPPDLLIGSWVEWRLGGNSCCSHRPHCSVCLAAVALSHCIRRALTAGTSDRSKEEEREDCLLLLLRLSRCDSSGYMAGSQTAAGRASAHLITTLLSQPPRRHVLISYRGFSPCLKPLIADIWRGNMGEVGVINSGIVSTHITS